VQQVQQVQESRGSSGRLSPQTVPQTKQPVPAALNKPSAQLTGGPKEVGAPRLPGAEAGDLLVGRMDEARSKFFHSMIVDSDKRTSSSSAHRTGTSVLPALGNTPLHFTTGLIYWTLYTIERSNECLSPHLHFTEGYNAGNEPISGCRQQKADRLCSYC
jgi:hypothetical protein